MVDFFYYCNNLIVMDNENAAYWIEYLKLQPHPEGGWYREIFRSLKPVLRPGGSEVKQACTSIYYLLENADYSGFHRIVSDELWYFHKGSPLHIHVIDEKGECNVLELSDKQTGSLSISVRGGLWFAAEIPSRQGFSLVSCAVAPGFEFDEFEMAEKDKMMELYPQHSALVNKLCR
jgi:predicted cupin superfamily sugar epimerase